MYFHVKFYINAVFPTVISHSDVVIETKDREKISAVEDMIDVSVALSNSLYGQRKSAALPEQYCH